MVTLTTMVATISWVDVVATALGMDLAMDPAMGVAMQPHPLSSGPDAGLTRSPLADIPLAGTPLAGMHAFQMPMGPSTSTRSAELGLCVTAASPGLQAPLPSVRGARTTKTKPSLRMTSLPCQGGPAKAALAGVFQTASIAGRMISMQC